VLVIFWSCVADRVVVVHRLPVLALLARAHTAAVVVSHWAVLSIRKLQVSACPGDGASLLFLKFYFILLHLFNKFIKVLSQFEFFLGQIHIKEIF